ncbi:MAG: bifunctional 4-hydroxy-3-methylbut-2-enyl diphosphate reductase/30S ribosomal protein S1 [Clostridia bacterium]|nr:bifunctional 4-hydroxy-3-methylbut-2-enyl diphosphate reductase/30S ribosomal protein S1 [Clostridia bacterium]
MPCKIARYAGYCAGVRKAVEEAHAAAGEAREKGLRCYSLGAVIHNPEAVEALRREGVIPIDRLEDAESGAMILLRSHGVAPEVEKKCRERGLIVRDCTCASVRALHRIVRESGEKGVPVILVGEPEHPEVQGTAGWCPGECHIVGTEEEAAALPPMEEALAVSQTTFSMEAWERITQILREKIPRLSVRCTVCPATRNRQTEARELAREMDAMVVVGGKNSANTRKLYEICRAICPRTILVERAEEIPPHFADIHKHHIGIAAGASTPDWSFKEVVTRMNDMEHIDQEPQEPVINATAEQEAPAAPETPEVQEAPAAEAQEAPAAAEPQEAGDSQALTMEDIEKTVVRIRPGQTVTGTVVQISDDEVCVNIGYKSDGLIKRSDMVEKDVKLGDEIEVEVVKVNDGEGNVLLSQRNIVNRKVWDALMEKYENNEYVDAVGKEAVKGGLLAQVEGGIRAFVPASQLAPRYVEKIDQFVGQNMKLKIIDVDKQKKRIVASRKQVIAEESAAKKAAAWDRLEEGAVVKGIVRRFADFGAFVDLGGVDGLIHITDMAWSRVGHPSDVLSINQEVEVKILSLDRERERIQLGYKQLQPKPWDNIEEKYPVGTVLERNVVRIRPFGAFIELEPGVDGLVHISQCAPTRIEKVEDVLQVGQPVLVKVLAVDPEAKRISLSIKDAMAAAGAYAEAPAEEAPAEEAPVEEAPAEEAAPAAEAPADAE